LAPVARQGAVYLSVSYRKLYIGVQTGPVSRRDWRPKEHPFDRLAWTARYNQEVWIGAEAGPPAFWYRCLKLFKDAILGGLTIGADRDPVQLENTQ
jgi:hypothetical protein